MLKGLIQCYRSTNGMNNSSKAEDNFWLIYQSHDLYSLLQWFLTGQVYLLTVQQQ